MIKSLTSPRFQLVLLKFLHLHCGRLVVHLQDPYEIRDGQHAWRKKSTKFGLFLFSPSTNFIATQSRLWLISHTHTAINLAMIADARSYSVLQNQFFFPLQQFCFSCALAKTMVDATGLTTKTFLMDDFGCRGNRAMLSWRLVNLVILTNEALSFWVP